MTSIDDSTETTAAQGYGKIGDNRRDWKYFDEKLAALDRNDLANIIERGRVLIEAKEELEHGAYEATVKRHFDLSFARKLRIIAGHTVLSNRSHGNALPPSVQTLYLLAKLPNDVLIAKLSDGGITPKLQRKEVAAWGDRGKVEVNGKPIERRPSAADQLRAIRAENDQLKSIVGAEHLFDPSNTNDRQIAETMVGRLAGWRGRAGRVARLMLQILDENKAMPAARQGKARSKPDASPRTRPRSAEAPSTTAAATEEEPDQTLMLRHE
jgi:hypothetical protein